MARGVALCPENRKTEGLLLDLTIRENIILALQARRGWTRPVPRQRQDELVATSIDVLRIRPGDPEAIVGSLSGGNQQKVLLARWLITEPKLLILDEPTRGIDVGAKAEIQRLVVELSCGGMAVLFISAELEEVLRLSHRIAVLRDRRMVAHLANDEGVDAVRRHGDHRERSSRMTKERTAAVTGHRLFWPLVALAALLVGNLVVHPELPHHRAEAGAPLRQPDRHPEDSVAAASWWRWA